MKNTSLHCFVLIALLTLLGGCKAQLSFTGADIGAAQTVSISLFPNYAPLAQPTLSQAFTEKLRDTFLSQSSLSMVKSNAHLKLEGEITGYRTAPQAIQGNETAALNRLTITVNVRYTNTLEESKSFESSFSQFADMTSGQNLSAVEDDLIEEINTRLTQDIFNRAVSNW